VFLIGVSESILPFESGNTGPENQSAIDEERRLFYVGITRAKKDLRMSYRGEPSRFLRESGLLASS
jgi:DNA helicase-2/ATP-dependent DNA helicase PcrA